MDDVADFRERLSKLVGRLGSSHAGERDAAVQAIDKALGSAGYSFAWLCDLVAGGELRNQGAVAEWEGTQKQDNSYLAAGGTLAGTAGSMFATYGKFNNPNPYQRA